MQLEPSKPVTPRRARPVTWTLAIAPLIMMVAGVTAVSGISPGPPGGGTQNASTLPPGYEQGAEVRLAADTNASAITIRLGPSRTIVIPVRGGTTTTTTSRQTTTTPVTTTTNRPSTTTNKPTTTTSRPTTTTAPPTGGAAAPAQSFWLHLNSTAVTDEQLATEARRRAYIVLNAWEGALIPKLKAANPRVQVFVYKDLSSTRSYACRNGTDDAQLPAGIGFCDADRNHPDWFLLSPGGQRLQYSGYAGHWQMDVGNVAYQNAWIDNVISASKASGFDGVLMDNALFSCQTYHEGVCPAKYPSDQSIQNAYKSMFANARSKFASAGLKTVANLANARLFAGAWSAYTENLDGAFDEWWLTFSDTNMLPEYDQGWSRQIAEIAANEARGKITWVQPHFGNTAQRPFRYAFASFLMVNGPRSAFAPIAQTDGYGDPSPWRPEYDWRLGSPTGAHRSVGPNLFRRDYTCGAVLVNANPTSSSAVTVALGGTYTDETGRSVTSVSLAGTSGSILRRAC